MDFGFSEELTQTGLSLMNDSYEEAVKEEGKEFHAVTQQLSDHEVDKLRNMPHHRAEALGTAWRDGLDEKYCKRGSPLEAISEGSSYVGMAVHQKSEDI